MASITTCPVLVTDDERGIVPCGEELEASRTEWRSGITLDYDGMAYTVSDWGSHYAFAEYVENGTRIYCANDHSENEIVTALDEKATA